MISQASKLAVFSLVAALCVAGSCAAQTSTTTPAAPAAGSAASATSAPKLNKDGKPNAGSVRKECRDSVKSQGLKGEEREKAVSECFLKQRPDLADREAALRTCEADAKSKNIAHGAAHKAFIKDCVKSKKSTS